MRAAKIGELTVENSYRCKRKKYEGVYGVDPRLFENGLPAGAPAAPRATGWTLGALRVSAGGGRAGRPRLAGVGRGRPLGWRKGTLAKGTTLGLARAGGFEGNLIKGTKHPLTQTEVKRRESGTTVMLSDPRRAWPQRH